MRSRVDVVVVQAQAEPADGEVRAAQNGLLHRSIGDMVHLAVKQLGVAHRADVHSLADPLRAFPGDTFLLQFVGESKPDGVQNERLLLGLLRVQGAEEAWFAEEEIQMLNPVEGLLECVVGVNGEVGRNDGKAGTGPDLCLEEVRHHPAAVVVPDPGTARRIWHKPMGSCSQRSDNSNRLISSLVEPSEASAMGNNQESPIRASAQMRTSSANAVLGYRSPVLLQPFGDDQFAAVLRLSGHRRFQAVNSNS